MLTGNKASSARRNPSCTPHADVQTKLSLFVGAPFQKAGFLIRAEVVESASHDKVASPCAVGIDMEVMFIRPDIIVAACPKDVSGRINDSTLSGIVWPHQNIEAGQEFQLQRSSRTETAEATRVYFRNVHCRPPIRFLILSHGWHEQRCLHIAPSASRTARFPRGGAHR